MEKSEISKKLDIILGMIRKAYPDINISVEEESTGYNIMAGGIEYFFSKSNLENKDIEGIGKVIMSQLKATRNIKYTSPLPPSRCRGCGG